MLKLYQQVWNSEFRRKAQWLPAGENKHMFLYFTVAHFE